MGDTITSLTYTLIFFYDLSVALCVKGRSEAFCRHRIVMPILQRLVGLRTKNKAKFKGNEKNPVTTKIHKLTKKQIAVKKIKFCPVGST